jgi:multiple sugar transport system substrate-binding protein
MKKAITILLVLCLVFSSVFAQGTKEAATTTEGTTNLKWALWDIASTTYYEPLIKAYEAKNPNVKIEMLDLGSADFMTMLSTQLPRRLLDRRCHHQGHPRATTNLVKRNLLMNLNGQNQE